MSSQDEINEPVVDQDISSDSDGEIAGPNPIVDQDLRSEVRETFDPSSDSGTIQLDRDLGSSIKANELNGENNKEED